jgi:hypothetical protein
LTGSEGKAEALNAIAPVRSSASPPDWTDLITYSEAIPVPTGGL